MGQGNQKDMEIGERYNSTIKEPLLGPERQDSM